MAKKEHYTIDAFKKALVGATIVDVLPNHSSPEGGQFILVTQRGARKTQVAVSGTDMGWWFTITEKK